MKRTFFNSIGAVAAVAMTLAAAGSSSAADWGSIKGKFVYEGKADEKPIQPNKDVEYCSKHKLVDEQIVLGEGGALQNVFVYLYLARGKTVEIHPDLKNAKFEPAVLDNHQCRFEPHAMTLWTAQPLEIRNTDPGLGHNTNGTALIVNVDFNDSVPNDKPLVKKFDKSEPIPTHIVCNIHPWMSAYVLVRDNPYMAVSGKDGSFEIKNVPAGKHDFVFWHEVVGNMRNLAVGKQKADRKGQISLDVPAGKALDLGEIKVVPAILKR